MKRLFTFIIDMILTLIILLGALAFGGYWAYKNVSLDTLGVDEQTLGLNELTDWTIEDWTNYVLSAVKDPSQLTLDKLEDEGFDADYFLSLLGVNVSVANKKDLKSFKSMAIPSLFTGDLSSVDLGVIFLFLPKDPDTGLYPIFSEGAREELRKYKLSDLTSSDESGRLGALSLLGSLKIGSVLSKSFTETADGQGGYTYSTSDKGLNLIANVPLSMITDSIGNPDKPFDLGYQVKEGELKHMGEMELKEVVASLGSTDDATYQEKYDSYKIFGSTKFSEIFTYNETTLKYDMQLNSIIDNITMSDALGYQLCTQNEECQVHAQVSDCDGDIYYSNGESAGKQGMEKKLLSNMLSLSVGELNGLDMSVLVDGIYLGSAFGYEIAQAPLDSEYCQIECDNQEDGHVHNYYFVDGEGKFVGDMYNEISNFTFEDALKGEVDVSSVVENTTIGEVMGYKLVEGEWLDKEDNPVSNQTAKDKILLGMYDKTVTGLKTIEFKDLMEGIVLGELLDLKLCTADWETCPVHHEECYEIEPYWFDKDGNKASVINNALADVLVTTLMEDGNAIQNSLKHLYVGDVMSGYVFSNGVWKKQTNNGLVELSEVEKLVAEIKFEEVFDGTLDFEAKVDGLKLSSLIDAGDNKILQFLCGDGTTVAQISTKVDGMTVKDVVDVDNNNVLKLLKDSNVKNLASDLNAILMGEIMGYVKCTGDENCQIHANCQLQEDDRKWFECQNSNHGENGEGSCVFEQLTGITAKLADLSVKEVSEGGFKNLVDDLCLGDVLDEDELNSGLFQFIDLDKDDDGVDEYTKETVPVKEISSRVTSGAAQATYSELKSVGIVNFSASAEEKLDAVFNNNSSSEIDEWRNLNMDELFHAIIELIPHA